MKKKPKKKVRTPQNPKASKAKARRTKGMLRYGIRMERLPIVFP